MVGAAGLTFAFIADGIPAFAATPAAASEGKALSPWVRIAADGTISIMAPATEMGQGSGTSLPLIVAEELDADWTKVKIVPAPVMEKIYGNPGFGGMMYTAGSNAVKSYYMPLRTFGAQVRRVLLDNAAKHWSVPVAELTTEPSTVVHAKSNRRISYGEIAGFADVPAQAPEIKLSDLKQASAFRLIGKDVLRAELPNKVNGTAQYSIDVQVPGMIYGAVLRSPVEGGTPETFDEAKVQNVKGVLDVVRLPYGVGVLASTPWAAFDGKAEVELSIKWNRTGTAWGFDSDKGMQAFAADARNLSVPVTNDWFKQGDAEAALKDAPTVLEAEYRCDYAYHAQMEPLNATASVSPDGQSAEVWCGTQSQTMALDAAAKTLGIPREKVKLNYMLLGGGFGRRGHRDEEFIVDAVLLSKHAQKPVKVLWTREDDVHNGRLRPITAHYLRAALDSSGKIVGWHQRIAGDRVTPYQDPVRYEIAKHKDFILMLGVEMKSYDIAEPVLRARLPRHRRAYVLAARYRLHRQQVRQRGVHGRDRAQARDRPRRAAARTAAAHPARSGCGAARGGDGGLGQEARRPRHGLRFHRLLGFAGRCRRGHFGRSGERAHQGAQFLVHDRLRPCRTARQCGRADRKQYRLRPRHGAHRADHRERRHYRTVELL